MSTAVYPVRSAQVRVSATPALHSLSCADKRHIAQMLRFHSHRCLSPTNCLDRLVTALCVLQGSSSDRVDSLRHAEPHSPHRHRRTAQAASSSSGILCPPPSNSAPAPAPTPRGTASLRLWLRATFPPRARMTRSPAPSGAECNATPALNAHDACASARAGRALRSNNTTAPLLLCFTSRFLLTPLSLLAGRTVTPLPRRAPPTRCARWAGGPLPLTPRLRTPVAGWAPLPKAARAQALR